MIELPYLHESTPFPNVNTALEEPNGLLAFGGTLDVNRLFNAYSNGIFPWFGEDEPILWWSPDPRSIIPLDAFYASRSLRKLAAKHLYRITLNYDFSQVIRACASIPRKHPGSDEISADTWITDDMQQAYTNLHHAGLAHSVEVWEDTTLVGGLYGVAIGEVFCGESMFHRKANTSKLAMLALVQHMRAHKLAFIDCQLPTDHLASLGATTLPRSEFLDRLHQHDETLDETGSLRASYQECWSKQDITP
ncbi:leucyl/phenylalanyl-tRNA--protein transferase [Alteromonas sp. ASW11-19]|uniref:Leucyl/phenylalanyl-tRNA--protein transferase n=1 Tax=Alteromonas salexigens TaxID=2982530 RepID=A0ABT2VR42_9ALTE|nr:leucyl/phenylalanyl-tRNA--protein transferase [Alteromonas salexigens]MCU7554384.1 leucyl/phenylalanyl-tRNA--protein transferase [Alteromonas salexigens]